MQAKSSDIFLSDMLYAGSACINNTITGGAPLVAICPVALGPCIVIMFVCKLIGANIVRLILRAKRGKA